MNRMYPLNTLRSEMDQLFNGFLGDWPALDRTAAFPPLNVWEDEQNYFVEAEIPGLRMEDLEVTVQREELSIKGARKEADVKDAVYHRRERGAGRFERTLRLPAPLDVEAVKASLQDGVLSISLPKAKEARPVKINVKCLEKK